MFPILVLISALLLAGCAALFSVTGIAQLFTGASLSAGIMAGSMELGKIVSVSFLYRYHKQIPKALRLYMWIGTIVIMIITSMGIYGYLSSAYATSAVDIQNKENQVTLYQSQQKTIDDNIVRLSTRNEQLQQQRAQQENRVDAYLQAGRATGMQQRLIREQDAEIKNNQAQIIILSKSRDSLALLATTTTNSIGTSGKIGTFYYIAQTFNMPLDTIVRWFILMLVVVFDPMSISLFLAYNIIIKKSLTTIISPSMNSIDTEPSSDKISSYQSFKNNINQPTESSNDVPYYMKPDYDWANDDRWRSDPAARGFRSHLGVQPNNT